jgi:hypothetical protein
MKTINFSRFVRERESAIKPDPVSTFETAGCSTPAGQWWKRRSRHPGQRAVKKESATKAFLKFAARAQGEWRGKTVR